MTGWDCTILIAISLVTRYQSVVKIIPPNEIIINQTFAIYQVKKGILSKI